MATSNTMKKLLRILSLFTSQYRLVILFSAIVAILYNYNFYSRFENIYPLSQGNIGLNISSVMLVFSIHLLLFSLISSRWFIKPILIVSTLLGWSALYFGYEYGTIVNTGMIQNTLQTDPAEAAGLFSFSLIASLVIFVAPVLYFIIKFRIKKQSLAREVAAKATTVVVSLIITAGAVLPFSADYASFFREYKSVRYYVAPATPIYSVFRYFHKRTSITILPLNKMEDTAPDAKIVDSKDDHDDSKELVVLIIGETARADHFQLNGYPRETNPKLSKRSDIISFSQMYSCGTATAVSVPCIFAADDRANFNDTSIYREQNALDILKEEGVKILWRDNNSSSKGVALRVEYQDYKTPKNNTICDKECRDVGMLVGLDDYVKSNPNKDLLIVLHQMGSHGPEYYKRYPKDSEHFKPVCESNQLAHCDHQSLINAYDNSIRYTDNFIDQTINFLQRHPNHETSLLYLSDHGESLGENGVYLHGLPYSIAPEQQKHVAALTWLPKNADFSYKKVLENKDKQLSQDNIYCSILDLFEIKTEACPEGKSIFDTMK